MSSFTDTYIKALKSKASRYEEYSRCMWKASAIYQWIDENLGVNHA